MQKVNVEVEVEHLDNISHTGRSKSINRYRKLDKTYRSIKTKGNRKHIIGIKLANNFLNVLADVNNLNRKTSEKYCVTSPIYNNYKSVRNSPDESLIMSSVERFT